LLVSGTVDARAGLPAVAAGYDLDPSFYDEAFEASGTLRPEYASVFAALDGMDLGELGEDVRLAVEERGVRFRGPRGYEPFVVDPIPRVFSAEEWARLEGGLVQRVRALNAFVTDIYADRRIIHSGRMPDRILDGAEHLEPDMLGVPVAGGVYAGVVGVDVVRDADGELMVLEDNVRTPSGLAYLEAALDSVDEALPVPGCAKRPTDVDWDLFGEVLRSAAIGGHGDPSIVLLSDGPGNSAWWEHEVIARRLALPLVTLADLEIVAGRLHARVDGGKRPVDVVYRRTDEDRLEDAEHRPTAMGDALLEPCRRGTLACVNAFGGGVADDKLVHAYVEEMIRFYLDEEPLISSIPTYDPCEPEQRAAVLERIHEMVVKPRTGHGGHGVVICPHAESDAVEAAARAVAEDPESYIVQETVTLSRHPTVERGALVPRHVDLRPFVLSAGERVEAVAGGLTRVSFESGALVVNSSQNGGGKATWVLE